MKHLTLDGRWIFARPRGGLTDTLAQIDRLRCHAFRYGRSIALDLSGSGLRVPFDTLFRPAPSFQVPVVVPDATLSAALDACSSVAPPELTHIVTRHQARISPAPAHNFVEAQSGVPLSVDLDRDHPARVLVHGLCGGGPGALRTLGHLRLKPEVANTLAARVASLGSDFAAVHIRHTDYQSDYKPLLAALGRHLTGRKVLLCTDNPAVIAEARRVWAGRVELCLLSTLPDNGGRPLHTGSVSDPMAHALDQLADLMALAAARTFFAAPLSPGAGRTRYSGYSVLALRVRFVRRVLENLLADAEPDLRRSVCASWSPLRELWLPPGAGDRLGHFRHVLSVWNSTRRVLRTDPAPW